MAISLYSYTLMKPTKLLSYLLPIVAGIVSFFISSRVVSIFARPKISIVQTYGQVIPWDALVVRKQCIHADVLGKVVEKWDLSSTDSLAKIFPKEDFGIRNIRSATWNDWDSVKEAKMALSGFDTLLFQDIKGLTDDAKTHTSSQAQTRKNLTIAVTPERPFDASNKRLLGLQHAVEVGWDEKFFGVKPDINIISCNDYSDVIRGLTSGDIDFALCSPFSTYITHEAMGDNLILLGQIQKTDLDGYHVYLVKSDDGMNNLKDIQNDEFIYASRESTSGYLIPLQMLSGLGLNLHLLKISKTPFRNHDAVIEKLRSLPNLVAGVPSDKLDPYFEAVQKNSFEGGILGACIGALFCYAMMAFKFTRKPV